MLASHCGISSGGFFRQDLGSGFDSVSGVVKFCSVFLVFVAKMQLEVRWADLYANKAREIAALQKEEAIEEPQKKRPRTGAARCFFTFQGFQENWKVWKILEGDHKFVIIWESQDTIWINMIMIQMIQQDVASTWFAQMVLVRQCWIHTTGCLISVAVKSAFDIVPSCGNDSFFFYNSVKSYVFLWCGRMIWLWYNSIIICQI